MILLLFFLCIQIANSSFYEQRVHAFASDDVIVDQHADSHLQCVHLCHHIDPQAGVLFAAPSCKCLKMNADEDNNQLGEGTLTEIFSQKAIQKAPSPMQKIENKLIRGNLALHKPSTQSETYSSAYAKKANDGDTSTRSATKGKKPCWWSVDLQKKSTVEEIVLILGNPSFKNGWIKDLVVKTSLDQKVWTICKRMGAPVNIQVNVTCASGAVTARYIRIDDPSKLSFTEVSVFGYAH